MEVSYIFFAVIVKLELTLFNGKSLKDSLHNDKTCLIRNLGALLKSVDPMKINCTLCFTACSPSSLTHLRYISIRGMH